MTKPKITKTKLLWICFGLTFIIFSAASLAGLIGLKVMTPFLFLMFALPVITLILHSIIVFDWQRAGFLLLLPALVGLVFEIVGVKFGTVFGGHYAYSIQQFSLMIQGVPLLVPIYWSVFVYTGYSLVNAIQVWTYNQKPSIDNKNVLLLFLLILLDGLLVVAIDLFMDPIMVHYQKWTWQTAGPYFGIPIGNFVGWFVVTIISTGIFRFFEYFFPQKKRKELHPNVYLITVLGYTLIWADFLYISLRSCQQELSLIGTLAMLPVILISLLLFVNWKQKKIERQQKTDKKLHSSHSHLI